VFFRHALQGTQCVVAIIGIVTRIRLGSALEARHAQPFVIAQSFAGFGISRVYIRSQKALLVLYPAFLPHCKRLLSLAHHPLRRSTTFSNRTEST
jgi:hypothetical protein